MGFTGILRPRLSHPSVIAGRLSIAWMHPFGDGNGRTARAVEAAILAHTKLAPWVSCALLSDHYNRTRTRYYHRLAQASRSEDDVGKFLVYAAAGFVDLLRDQMAHVQGLQRHTAWVNYVHEVFQRETQGDTSKRRRTLVLALREDESVKRPRLRRLTPELAEMYANKGDRTLSHDLNKLSELRLVEGDARRGYRSRIQTMDAFLPKLDGSFRILLEPETASAS
jgi:cell filamentation protein, protein adenylyltransferase